MSLPGLFVSTLCDLMSNLNDSLGRVGRIDREAARKAIEAAVNIAQAHVLDLETDARVRRVDRVIVGSGEGAEPEKNNDADGGLGKQRSHDEELLWVKNRVWDEMNLSRLSGDRVQWTATAQLTARPPRELWFSLASALRTRASGRAAAGTRGCRTSRARRGFGIARQDLREHGHAVRPRREHLGALVDLIRVDLVERVALGVMRFSILGFVLDDGKCGHAVRKERQMVGTHHGAHAELLEVDSLLERLDDLAP